MDGGYSDLDLRSRDIMYVCYKMNENGVYDSHPSILCNVTTHQFAEIKSRKSGCFIATVACVYNSWEVEISSSFRDNILSKGVTGSLRARSLVRVRFTYTFIFHVFWRQELGLNRGSNSWSMTDLENPIGNSF